VSGGSRGSSRIVRGGYDTASTACCPWRADAAGCRLPTGKAGSGAIGASAAGVAVPERTVSDELARRKAPRVLVQFVRCQRDDVELAADQMRWLVQRLPITPDRIELTDQDGGAVEVRAFATILGAEVSFGITLGVTAGGRIEARALDAPPGTEGTARAQVDEWLQRLNDELVAHGKRFGELRVVRGCLRATKIAVAAPPTGAGAVPAPAAAPAGTASTPPSTPAPSSPAPAEPPGGCGIPFFGMVLLVLIALLVLAVGALAFVGMGRDDGTAIVTTGTPASTAPGAATTTSRVTTSTTAATTSAAPTRPVTVRCGAVWVDHSARLAGFPSSIILAAGLDGANGWTIVVDDAGAQMEYAGTVDATGAGYLEFGITHYGTYVIAQATARMTDGSEEPITDPLVDALGSSRIDVGPDAGNLLGDPSCTQGGGTAGDGSTIVRFFGDLSEAVRTRDTGFLLDNLHESVFDRYRRADCRAYLEGLATPSFDARVLEVVGAGRWAWETDGLSLSIDDATTVRLHTAQDGVVYSESEAHVAVDGERVSWFTDCGMPRPGAR
jgi:hypothetical protein